MKPTSLASLLLLAPLAACGSSAATPDAPPATIDARAADAALPPPDAPTCELTGYPAAVRPVSVDLGAEFPLTLDGNGTRCDQILRALLDPNPAKRPPEFAEMDVVGAAGRCSHDDVLNREIVRIDLPQYGGQPIFWPVQDALVHVSAANKVVYLHADFLPIGKGPLAACLSGDAIGATIVGRPMTYQKFQQCVPGAAGSYPIAAGDTVEVGEEGAYLDDAGNLHRARAVDVYLAAANVTPEVANSDAFCCSGAGVDHCVGQKLIIDALTGELLATQHHCHTC